MTKYSNNFERDYIFYFNNRHIFTFNGGKQKYKAIYDCNGISAKEAFYKIDSTGINIPTNEFDLLNELLLCKASVNFHIKQWAESRADGTLPGDLFYGEDEDTIQKEFNLPDWVINAVESQKFKIWSKKNEDRYI